MKNFILGEKRLMSPRRPAVPLPGVVAPVALSPLDICQVESPARADALAAALSRAVPVVDGGRLVEHLPRFFAANHQGERVDSEDSGSRLLRIGLCVHVFLLQG